MQTLRIFISSPGDVAEERERARQVVQGLRRRYARHFDLVPVFWEDMPLGLETGFQEGIDLLLSRDRGVDIAVFILWSRLGSALGGNFQRPDGRPYRSGTERELDLMLQARAAQDGKRPHIIAYARQDEATFEEALRGTSTAEKEERLRQKKLVESFIKEEFHDSQTGTNLRAYHTYHRPQSFSERLRVHLQEVLDGLTGADIGRPAWEIDERGPPFLGLESFRFEHAEVFFGREDEISEARLRLAAAAKRGTAFLLVGGGSGTGKSSLAAAGILPDVVAHEIDESVSRWLHASFTPAALGGDPALGMARILWSAVPSLAARGEAADLVDALRHDPRLAVKLVLLPALKAEATSGAAVRLILLVDQLEEVFTDSRLTPEARDQFVAILEALASSGAVWVVATLRGDFYPRFLGCPALVRLATEGAQLPLVPPGADALRRMIESPALLSGLAYEKTGETTLADRILRDVSGQAELLPLLEDLLRELFEKRSPEGVLTVAAYESLGGIEGSLAKRAEASLATLPSDVQLAFPEVLRKLVASGEGPEGTAVRRRAPLDSFSPGSPARTLVDKLVSDRLATAAAGDDGTPEVTIAHEAILRVWPRVAAWIQENGEFLRLRDRLTARMREKAPLTAADPLLPAARAILETRRDAFEPEVAAYVERQVTAIDAERQRRDRVRRAVATGLSGLTIAAMITAGAALWQWREADAAKAKAETAQAAEVEQRAAAESAKTVAEAESLKAKRQLYVANLYKLQTALDRPQRALANEFFRDALTSYREAYGDAASVPIELVALRPALDQAVKSSSGQGYGVNSFALSPDGTRTATALDDHTTRIRDAASGKELAVLKGYESWVTFVVFSPDGTRLGTGSLDKTARLWDVATGRELAVLKGHENGVSSVAFSPDGTRLATGSDDMTARLWDTATGNELAVLKGHENPLNSVAFSPDGRRLATGSDDRTARLWDTATGKELAVLKGHESTVLSIAFSPDGMRLATGSWDKTARLWDTATGTELAVLKGHDDRVVSVAFSPDCVRLATGAGDNTARLWEVATGNELAVLKGHENSVVSVAFSPDGKWLATRSWDDTVRMWDVSTGHDPAVLTGHETLIQSVAFSSDGARLATGSRDNTARLWDAATGKELAELKGQLMNVLRFGAFSPDCVRLATPWIDTTVRLWDSSTGKELAALKGHEGWVTSVAFSPDGTRLATGSADNTARLWDAATGKELAVLKGHESAVESVAFSPDGTRLATGAGDGTARLWDAATGKELAVLKGHTGSVYSVAFSRDGTRLATGSSDKTARLWEAATGKELAVLKGHEDRVTSAAFSPDGTRLATGSHDSTARLWEVATGRELAVLKGHVGTVESVAFSPDGTRLATGSEDNTARLWGLSNAEIHANRLAAEAAQERLKPLVIEWFSGEHDDRAIQTKLAAAKETLSAADWREAANLVFSEAQRRAKQERLSAARDRFTLQLDEWFAAVTTPNFDSVGPKFVDLMVELPQDESSVFAEMYMQRKRQIVNTFWTTIRSNKEAGLAVFKKAAGEAAGNATALNELAWGVEAQASDGAFVWPELLAAAVAAARRGVDLEANNGLILDTLAHLLARQGQLDEAIAMQRKAVDFATAEDQTGLAAFLAELEAKAAAAKAPSAEKADEPATSAAAEPALNGGPVGQPTDAATESPIEPAPSAP